jgi:hypothetical protein
VEKEGVGERIFRNPQILAAIERRRCRATKKAKQIWCKKITLARFVIEPVSPVIALNTARLKLLHAVIRHLVTACPFGRFLPGL